jgi:hypothetical protein
MRKNGKENKRKTERKKERKKGREKQARKERVNLTNMFNHLVSVDAGVKSSSRPSSSAAAGAAVVQSSILPAAKASAARAASKTVVASAKSATSSSSTKTKASVASLKPGAVPSAPTSSSATSSASSSSTVASSAPPAPSSSSSSKKLITQKGELYPFGVQTEEVPSLTEIDLLKKLYESRLEDFAKLNGQDDVIRTHVYANSKTTKITDQQMPDEFMDGLTKQLVAKVDNRLNELAVVDLRAHSASDSIGAVSCGVMHLLLREDMPQEELDTLLTSDNFVSEFKLLANSSTDGAILLAPFSNDRHWSYFILRRHRRRGRKAQATQCWFYDSRGSEGFRDVYLGRFCRIWPSIAAAIGLPTDELVVCTGGVNEDSRFIAYRHQTSDLDCGTYSFLFAFWFLEELLMVDPKTGGINLSWTQSAQDRLFQYFDDEIRESFVAQVRCKALPKLSLVLSLP